MFKNVLFPCLDRAPQETKKENALHSTSYKRCISTGDMGRKVVKRARIEIEPLRINRQVSSCRFTRSSCSCSLDHVVLFNVAVDIAVVVKKNLKTFLLCNSF